MNKLRQERIVVSQPNVFGGFSGKLSVFFRNQRSIYKEISKSIYELDTIIGFKNFFEIRVIKMVYSRCKGKIRRSHFVQMARKLLKSYGEILERQLLSKNTDKRRLFYPTHFLTQGTIGPIWLRPIALAEVFTLLTYAKREKFAFFRQYNTTLIETKISKSPEFSF